MTKVGSSEIKHENEFIGGYSRAIITPLTYRCIQAMYMSSVGMLHGAILQGANQLGNYRDGIVFDMAAYLGKISQKVGPKLETPPKLKILGKNDRSFFKFDQKIP